MSELMALASAAVAGRMFIRSAGLTNGNQRADRGRRNHEDVSESHAVWFEDVGLT